jgi:hypothetical protein
MTDTGPTDLIGIAKLVETIGKAVGWYLKPQQVRRLAAANADAEITRELGHQSALDIAQRAETLRKLESIREHRNLEAVIREAGNVLSGRQHVSASPVEPDWVAEFFSHARQVSDGDMQALWARLLAEEIASPGEISRRTLVVLRQLSKLEAELLARFSTVVWHVDGEALGLRIQAVHDRTQPETIRRLQEAGLLLYGQFHGFNQVILPRRQIEFRYLRNVYMGTHKAATQVDLHAARLTSAGSELLRVCRPTPMCEIEEAFLRHFDQIGLDVRKVEG